MLVKATYKTVYAFDANTGSAAWPKGHLKLPHAICGASHTSSDDGKIVVAYYDSERETRTCNQLMQLDLTTGSRGWTVKIPNEHGMDIMTRQDLVISGDIVTATRIGGNSAFAIEDGEKVFGMLDLKDGCRPSGFAGGQRLVAFVNCGSAEPYDYQVQEIDPATGKARWTHSFPKGETPYGVYSLDPLVINVSTQARTKVRVTVLGDKGKPRSHFALSDEVDPGCTSADMPDSSYQSCPNALIEGNTLYLPQTSSDVGTRSALIGLDLRTGKERSKVPSPDDGALQPIRVEGDVMLVYAGATRTRAGALLSVPLTGGEPTALLRLPHATRLTQRAYDQVRTSPGGGLLVLTLGSIPGDEDRDPPPQIMTFGP
ncbi:PQQ-binding-like beta-propeller repeat protein [Streptomyces sp. Je 1-332]|uniref:outer membrane protein assembly factor BamB family protein n=1 Tax=Streptomyces sp. Je 1-332 TaxID=3231270 RepID=UPI00345AE137